MRKEEDLKLQEPVQVEIVTTILMAMGLAMGAFVISLCSGFHGRTQAQRGC